MPVGLADIDFHNYPIIAPRQKHIYPAIIVTAATRKFLTFVPIIYLVSCCAYERNRTASRPLDRAAIHHIRPPFFFCRVLILIALSRPHSSNVWCRCTTGYATLYFAHCLSSDYVLFEGKRVPLSFLSECFLLVPQVASVATALFQPAWGGLSRATGSWFCFMWVPTLGLYAPYSLMSSERLNSRCP